MNIRKENGNVFVDNETFERDETFREYIDHGKNGVIYCRKEGVINNIFHVQENGNDKKTPQATNGIADEFIQQILNSYLTKKQ